MHQRSERDAGKLSPPEQRGCFARVELDERPVTCVDDIVQTPSKNGQFPVLLRREGKRATLGQRGSLQSKTKAAEVLGASLSPRARGREAHRGDSLITRHPSTIVDDGDLKGTRRAEQNLDVRRVGGDRVVDDVSYSRFDCVADRAHRFEERGIRGDNDGLHEFLPADRMTPSLPLPNVPRVLTTDRSHLYSRSSRQPLPQHDRART